MRVAVVDIGPNSTRLLIAQAEDGRVLRELQRECRLTRRADGGDPMRALNVQAMERRFALQAAPRSRTDDVEAVQTEEVLARAVRHARNGAAFTQPLERR